MITQNPELRGFLVSYWKVCKCGHPYHLGHVCENKETFFDEKKQMVVRVCVCRHNYRDYLDGNVSMHALLGAVKDGTLQERLSDLMELEYEEMKGRK